MMKNILVAEDNAVNRELVREVLEAHGYSVFEACNGQEALQRIAESPPDLLLLDLGMPVLDGFGVITKIRNDPRWSALPVLAVTAYAMNGDRDKILNSGFDGYLSKPINAALLLEELTRLLKNTDGREATESPARN
jgi:two-component system cell cycle response regulator DivK